jgi:8-oxo-dGTP pyrophosphatase MutT (NUDIX family)
MLKSHLLCKVVGEALPRSWLITKLMQSYWRWTRALTLGTRVIVLDREGRVLLVRHTYTPGWHFPGGGVELGETVEAAMRRELLEEAGIEADAPPELFGIYSNTTRFPGDHVVLYVVRNWRQAHEFKPTREIAEIGFFAPDDLPGGTSASVARRMSELAGQSAKQADW